MKKRLVASILTVILMLQTAACGNLGSATDTGSATSSDAFQIIENASVSYLGPAGTYTEEATKLFFSEKAVLMPEETVSDAIEMILTGNADYAVIPQENTLGGAVINYVDALGELLRLIEVGASCFNHHCTGYKLAVTMRLTRCPQALGSGGSRPTIYIPTQRLRCASLHS